jgi:hypothetical protein
VLIALMQWGDHWVAGCDREPVRVVERESGVEIATIAVVSSDGRPLGPGDVRMVPGPGAGAVMRARLASRKKPVEAAHRATPALDLLADDDARDV